MAVIGAGQAHFERGIIQPDGADPGSGDQEMDVGPFLVHVGDAVGGVVVLHAGARQLAAAPVRLAAAVVGARRRLAENAAVVLRRDAVVVAATGVLGRLPDRHPIGFKLLEAWPKLGIDIALQHLRGGHDMRVGIVDAEPVPHGPSPLLPRPLGAKPPA